MADVVDTAVGVCNLLAGIAVIVTGVAVMVAGVTIAGVSVIVQMCQLVLYTCACFVLVSACVHACVCVWFGMRACMPALVNVCLHAGLGVPEYVCVSVCACVSECERSG